MYNCICIIIENIHYWYILQGRSNIDGIHYANFLQVDEFVLYQFMFAVFVFVKKTK